MATKKQPPKRPQDQPAAEVTLQPITSTIEQNFMPYAMSVIVSRAIPEIDGFKPSHRKLLYTMYKMGLLTGPRTKSANVVGSTMKLNPHGDGAIYETLVRLTRGNETLIHPFIDSKGSFGKHYSSDMEYAASRYTEVKLDSFCNEIFDGIDRDAVDFCDNYDATMQEPTLLPTTFPNILISPNKGIAVAMSSSICSFNLAEVCDGTIQLLHNPESTVDQMLDIIRAPDFQGGASLIYNREQMREIYRSGKGSIKLRARYVYDKKENCIDVIQIPYSTTIEEIMKKLGELVKANKLREITDFRDEIDLNGFKLTIDLRRGVDPDKLMTKLYKLTPLESSFDCNFNVLINRVPRQMGVCEILNEWIRFRMSCVRRELSFDLAKKKDKLHLLQGLGKILLDIDKAIRIIRETKQEKDVIPNLMAGFGIDRVQAEYIAEIKLRNLNAEYLINRSREISDLQAAIADLEDLLGSDRRMREYIARQLREIKRKYGKPRQTQLLYDDEIELYREEAVIENYPVKLFLTYGSFFKKIRPASLKASEDQKLKEDDSVRQALDASNADELLVFSNRAQVYKARVSDFDTCRAAELGDYLPAKLGFDPDETVLSIVPLQEYRPEQNMIFLFENGKGVRVPLSAYQTKANRRKLTGAYSDASPAVAAIFEPEPTELFLLAEGGRAILIDSRLIALKATRSSQGVTLCSLKKAQKLIRAMTAEQAEREYQDVRRCRKLKVPAVGVSVTEKSGDGEAQ